jgi:hypothetical protein
MNGAIHFIVIAVAVSVILAHAFIWHNESRLDDLEDRVTTMETVRIEVVAPPGGVSP